MDTAKLIEHAKAGHSDDIIAMIPADPDSDDFDEIIVTAYQWLRIAEIYGSEDAGEHAESLLDAYLSR